MKILSPQRVIGSTEKRFFPGISAENAFFQEKNLL